MSASLHFLCSADAAAYWRGYAACGPDGRDLNLLDFARALSMSSGWKEMPRATLVVRENPSPVMGVVGRFDEAAEVRLKSLGPQLAQGLTRLRYVSYAQVEEDCERLADRLVRRFGHDELRRFRFTAIPRGGFVVLGILSYMLDLKQIQLEPPHPPEAPLVIVDDCALSGFRFGGFLSRCQSHQIVFAHLYSHPDLRAAIEAREPRVASCLTAQDFHDHAPENLGTNYASWKERALARFDGGPGYWIGQPDRLCFPWSEPDVSVWNPVTERLENGWRLIPPELCLKNRQSPGWDPVPVQVQPEGRGPLRPSADVLFGEFEGDVVVGNLRARESFTLAGVAADMWKAIIAHGNLEAAATSLSNEYEVEETTLRADLQGFVDDLLSRDLLIER